MKSIKEKAFELFPEMQTDSDDWDVIEEQCDRDDQRKAYRLGANYVLDEVECILEDNNLWDCEEICNELKALIEQLKK
jgi:hypothetical protein